MKKSKLSTYILLDRSGSMSGSKWEHAIGSINSYVAELTTGDEIIGDVTVAAFDGHHINPFNTNINLKSNVSFDILRENQILSKFKPIEINETSPRGSTPLYDATAQLINMVETDNSEKAIIIIMTDGEENASTSYSLNAIRDRIKSCTNRGWEVVFLGSEFNADTVAQNFGLGLNKVVNNAAHETGATMDFYSTAARSYASTGAAIDTTLRRAEVKK